MISLIFWLFAVINVISWVRFGYFGGILTLVISCLSIVFIVLRYGVLSYNGYIVLFGLSAYLGYRIFLKRLLARNEILSKLESLEVDKNSLLSNISKKEEQLRSAKARVERYTALKALTEALSSTLELKKTGALITERAFDIIGRSERSLLFLIDEEKQGLELFSYKQADTLPGQKAKRREQFDAWIVKQRKPLIVEDLDSDFRFSPEALSDPEDRRFKSIIGAPLISEQKVIGVLRLDSVKNGAYVQDDLRLLNIMADLSAVSIGNSTLYQRTNELAITDGLTGLYVQRFFKERLTAASVGREKVSILMIDLDCFKTCNDKYGHVAGDILLRRIAGILGTVLAEEMGTVLHENCPPYLISRYGGEEFAVILFGMDKRNAADQAEKIRKRVEETVFTLRRDQINITVSVGVSSFPEDARTPEGLLKIADENLYKAKAGGRNRVWS